MKRLVFDEFALEQVDLKYKKHELFIERLIHDRSIQKELFIDKEQFDSINRSDILSNNSFIVKMDDIPVGYIETSLISNGNVSLSIGVEKSFRNEGYGTLIISYLSDYLLGRDDSNRINVLVNITKSKILSIKEDFSFFSLEYLLY